MGAALAKLYDACDRLSVTHYTDPQREAAAIKAVQEALSPEITDEQLEECKLLLPIRLRPLLQQ